MLRRNAPFPGTGHLRRIYSTFLKLKNHLYGPQLTFVGGDFLHLTLATKFFSHDFLHKTALEPKVVQLVVLTQAYCQQLDLPGGFREGGLGWRVGGQAWEGHALMQSLIGRMHLNCQHCLRHQMISLAILNLSLSFPGSGHRKSPLCWLLDNQHLITEQMIL